MITILQALGNVRRKKAYEGKYYNKKGPYQNGWTEKKKKKKKTANKTKTKTKKKWIIDLIK